MVTNLSAEVMRILVVEDQAKIAEFIRSGLKENGFVVDHYTTGEEGYEQALTEPYDAMVLDIMLPGRDGLSILRSLREKGVTMPVIVLTARSELNERVLGLELGADDYLTKPFFTEELVARLRAQIRRTSGVQLNILKVADLSLNLISREVQRGEETLDLTAREFALLEFLIRSPGRVYTRSQISSHVWNMHFDPGTNMVDVTLGRLRRKVDEGRDVKLIETVRGVGYRLKELS